MLARAEAMIERGKSLREEAIALKVLPPLPAGCEWPGPREVKTMRLHTAMMKYVDAMSAVTGVKSFRIIQQSIDLGLHQIRAHLPSEVVDQIEAALKEQK
jgi:hypothetical protein